MIKHITSHLLKIKDKETLTVFRQKDNDNNTKHTNTMIIMKADISSEDV